MSDEFLDCPECGADAIPGSGWSQRDGWATWREDDPEVRCPGCGVLLRVYADDDDEHGGFMRADVVDEPRKTTTPAE